MHFLIVACMQRGNGHQTTSAADRCNAIVYSTRIQPISDGTLSGLKFAIKDNIDVAGVRTTACSRILEGYVPTTDAFVVERLRVSGAEIVGKANNHEFAVGATNTSSIFGPVRNPVDPDRISGGSSGGSVAAVASGIADVGIGTDTGGSIRVPAALCGVTGFKPTTGIIPTDGVIPLSRTMDTVGIAAMDPGIIEKVFTSIIPQQVVHLLNPPKDVRRIGLMLFDDTPVSRGILSTIESLDMGLDLNECEIAGFEKLTGKARRTITSAEGASYHRHWLETKPDLYFADVREVLSAGLQTSTAEYIEAWNIVRKMMKEYERSFAKFDLIMSPVATTVAPTIAEVTGRELSYREILLGRTELFNAVFAPSISLNVCSLDGLPCGLMVSGRRNDDLTVLSFARKLQSQLRNI